MQERRHFARTKCFKGAQIQSHGLAGVACIVRNVSAEGAKLQLPYSVVLPAEFDLCLYDGGRICQCRVIWHTSREAGIRFMQPA